MGVFACAASCLLAAACAAQAVPESGPAPDALIAELVANAENYRAKLPSITAKEVIVSEASAMLIFREKVTTEGMFRVLNHGDGTALDESRQITTYNGKPMDLDTKPHLPLTMKGGFGQFQDMFFTAAHRACYAFTLVPNSRQPNTITIDVTVPQQLEERAGCPEYRHGVTGRVVIDRATHQIVHMERTVPAAVTAKTNYAPFASVDMAPAKVGEETFWLPTVVVGKSVSGKVHATFTARYSDYHRFTGTSTLRDVMTKVDPEPADNTPR